jgi:hypothetical protein
MINCIKCNDIQIKEYPSHAKIGYGRCQREEHATFYSLQIMHDCVKFNAAPDDIIEKRIAWHENRKG